MTWQTKALCIGQTEVFFPSHGNHTYAQAEALCAACPVLVECRADVTEYEVDVALVHGYRAGMDPKHRAQRLQAELGRTSGRRRQLAREALALAIEGKMTHEIADLIGQSKRNVARLLKDARLELEEQAA